LIPQANWGLWFVDSEEAVGENGVAENAFDGVTGTIWHTKWYGGSPSPPHEIQIDLGGSYTIGGFRYLPRQDGGVNGGIARYEFYVSADGLNWGTAVAAGTFAKTAAEKEVLFPDKPGRFVRLRALSEVNGKPWTSIAELNVLGSATSGNPVLPSVTVSPSTVAGGNPSTGTVTLSGSAPAGGVVVALSSSNPSVASVPGSVTVPEGAASATFPIATSAVTTSTSVTVSASYAGVTTTVTLTVSPETGGVGLIPQANWGLWFVDSEEVGGGVRGRGELFLR